jgi:hypothetical protein
MKAKRKPRPNRVASDDLLAAQSKLIALAAEMAIGKGLPSSFVDDHKWPKTTPVTAIRMVSQEFERMDRTTKDWAYRLRQISNSLTDNAVLSGASVLTDGLAGNEQEKRNARC